MGRTRFSCPRLGAGVLRCSSFLCEGSGLMFLFCVGALLGLRGCIVPVVIISIIIIAVIIIVLIIKSIGKKNNDC